MKKWILLFFIALFCVSCDPAQNAWIWNVKNGTEQTLMLKFPYSDTYQTYTLLPGKTIFINNVHTKTGARHNLHFDYCFKRAVSEHGEDVYWQILSEDEVILKTWNYSDRGLPGQRFFENSSWHYTQDSGQGFIAADYIWTFEIQPEDISSN